MCQSTQSPTLDSFHIITSITKQQYSRYCMRSILFELTIKQTTTQMPLISLQMVVTCQLSSKSRMNHERKIYYNLYIIFLFFVFFEKIKFTSFIYIVVLCCELSFMKWYSHSVKAQSDPLDEFSIQYLIYATKNIKLYNASFTSHLHKGLIRFIILINSQFSIPRH